jgi:antibiotic biosynthesis monooxygenase (ABM) superfamily enzyme
LGNIKLLFYTKKEKVIECIVHGYRIDVQSYEMPTLIVKRLIKPGYEKDYERNLSELIAHSEKMDGYMGINVTRPENKSYPLYVFSAKFDTETNLQNFKESDYRKAWLKELYGITQEPIHERTINKHDWWFALPGAHIDIPQYKMVIVTTIAAYPVVLGLNFINGPSQDIAMLGIKTFIVVIITISVISYITMPIMLSLLKKWLYVPK